MQPALMLVPLIFTFVQSLYHDWPMERRAVEDRPAPRQRTADYHQHAHHQPTSTLFSRERRSDKLCGKKLLKHLFKLCNSCILPAGSEIIKRSVNENDPSLAFRRLLKRELSIAEKCCSGQCSMSELEALCCSKGWLLQTKETPFFTKETLFYDAFRSELCVRLFYVTFKFEVDVLILANHVFGSECIYQILEVIIFCREGISRIFLSLQIFLLAFESRSTAFRGLFCS